MPSEVEPALRPGARAQSSPLMELQFTLFILQRGCPNAEKRPPPWFDDFVARNPQMAERVAGFWPDEGVVEWGELLVLAMSAGVLFGRTLEEAWPALRTTAEAGVVVPELPSEEPNVRPVLQARLDRLHESGELRERYFDLLQTVWAAVQRYWEPAGRSVAEDMVEQLRKELPRHDDPRALLPPNHLVHRDYGCGPRVAPLIERGEMVVVPLGLAGVGSALWALPGVVIAAYGPDAGSLEPEHWDRAEATANRFKTLSDPTRNAILHALLHGRHTVTELAARFGVSQPTVSVHVKLLKDAGLLESEKVKGQTFYRATRERVQGLMVAGAEDLIGKT